MNRHLFLIFILFLLCSCDTTATNEDGFLAQPGPILFISNESGTPQLYSMEPDGSDVHQLTNDSTTSILDAVWSPDGRKIALLIRESSSTDAAGIYVVKADGTGRYRVTGTNGQFLTVSDPIWSPDGMRIAFTAQLRPEGLGLFDLFSVEINGGKLSQIGSPQGMLPMHIGDWSSDGTRLLGWFYDTRVQNLEGQHVENGTILTFRMDGIVLDTLMQTEGAPDYAEPFSFPMAPLWSNNEERMAFTKRLIYTTTQDGRPHRAAQEDLYHTGAADIGAREARLTKGEYRHIYTVAWSPDDSKILASATNPYPNRRPFIDPEYTTHIVLVKADGSGLKDITPFPYASCKPTSWRK